MKKNGLLLLVLLLSVILFGSCKNDGYSLDKFKVSIATAYNPNGETYFHFIRDSQDSLWIAATNRPYYRPVTGQRAFINYTILSKKTKHLYWIKLNDFDDILTKNVSEVTANTQDSIGHDPIDIHIGQDNESEMWIGSDYLNIGFNFKAGLDGPKHLISLVIDKDKTYPDGKTHLEFRHNAEMDGGTEWLYGFVSFNLKSLQSRSKDQKTLDLVIDYTGYDGKPHSEELTYNFNDVVTVKKSFNNIDKLKLSKQYFQ